MGDGADLAAIARAIIDDNRFMTLGTADKDGLPWASPVWYAPSGYHEFLWVSDRGARHSRNLAGRPELGIVIFDSRATESTAQAVYMSATAQELMSAELERGIDAFSSYSQAQGAPAWETVNHRGGVAPVREDASQPARPAPLHLYRATASEHFVLDPDAAVDRRVPVIP